MQAPVSFDRHQAADTISETILNELNAAFTDFRVRNDARLDEIEAAMNEQSVRDAAQRLNGGCGLNLPVDRAYTDTFAGYFRKGSESEELKQANASGFRATVHAAMSISSTNSGGYLAPTEWDRKVQQELKILSPMRRIADVRSTTTQAYSTLWNSGGFASGWVGETAARPETATPSFDPIEFQAGEIYANPAITQRLGTFVLRATLQILGPNQAIAAECKPAHARVPR